MPTQSGNKRTGMNFQGWWIEMAWMRG
jgi:hypothetical protein